MIINRYQSTDSQDTEALSKYKPGSYELVILDIKMPKMDGFELYQKIRKKDNNTKICFLTASELYYEKFRKKEFFALDGNLFIRKPIGNQELAAQVNKMINRQDRHLEIIFLSQVICSKRLSWVFTAIGNTIIKMLVYLCHW